MILQANQYRTPAPTYTPGQLVWLKAKDLPLRVESRKLVPRFVGPFEVEHIVNPSAICLKLPASMKIHPTFHVSQLQLVGESDLILIFSLASSSSVTNVFCSCFTRLWRFLFSDFLDFLVLTIVVFFVTFIYLSINLFLGL